jgi:hypothetical protein
MFKKRFKQWDCAYIRPYLIRGKKHREPKITETYWALTIKEATELPRRNNHRCLTELCNDNPTVNSPHPK